VPKRAIGRYAKGTQESIKLASVMQALAVAHLQEDFSAEDEEEFNLERLSFERYITELQSAVKTGTLEEFNEKLRRLMVPIISQVAQQAQAEQQGAP
jgi:hypothetical protein